MDSKYLNTYIKLLRKRVEDKFGASMVSPRDFEGLSESIAESRVGTLSTSTLKRVWGYVRDTRGKHTSTLNILANYAGYEDGFKEFVKHCDSELEVESVFDHARVLDVFSLKAGDRVEVEWMPDRLVVLEYAGDCVFEVVEAHKCILSEGMRVRCSRIIEGERLLLDVISNDGISECIYQVGKIHGVVWRIVTPE